MNTIKTFLFGIVFMMIFSNSYGQDWTKDLQKDLYDINWIRQAIDGTLIVGGTKATAGVNPENGEILWINKKLKSIESSGISILDDMPYFLLNTGSAIRLIENQTGESILNSKEDNASVMNYKLLPDLKAILFQIKKNKKYELVWYDLDSASPTWSVDMGKAKGGLKGLLKGRSSFLKGAPVIVDNTMIVIYKETVMAIDITNGNQLWSNTYDDKIAGVVASNDGSQVFIGVKKNLDVVGITDGKSALGDMLKVGGKLTDVQQGNDGILLLTGKGMNILNTDNTLRWKKLSKTGLCSEVIPIDDGYIVISKYPANGNVTRIDKNGKKVWSEKYSGATLYTAPIDKGILYISNAGSNIFSYEDGKKVNKKDVNINGSPAISFDDAANQIVIFSNKKLTTIDLATGNAKEVAKKIKLKKFNPEKTICTLEVRDNGYFLNANQAVVFIDKNGTEKYNEYYKPVTSSNMLGAIGGFAGVDLSAVSSDFSRLNKLINTGSLKSARKDGASATSTSTVSVFGTGGSLSRMTATKTSNDHAFILSSTGFKKQALLKISKDTGVTEQSIDCDKQAIYHIDDYLKSLIMVKGSKLVSKPTNK